MNKLIETTLFIAENSVCISKDMRSQFCTRCINSISQEVAIMCSLCVFNSRKHLDTCITSSRLNSTIQLIASKQIP